MSQNYDLLRQIEYEREMPIAHPPRSDGDALRALKQLDLSPELMGLAQIVFLSNGADTPHDVLFCGVDRGNESTRICFELGRLLAAFSGQSVCLVDGDIHGSRLWKLLKEARVATKNDPWRDGCTEIEPNLWVADADSLDPTHRGVLAEADVLKKTLMELKSTFYFVLLNAPGANERSDAGALGQIVDGTVLVIEADSTRKAAALRATKSLQAMNVRLLGSVLNDRTFPIPVGLYSKL